MLRINDEEYEILSEEIKYVNANNNGIKGYSILVLLNFLLYGVKGYLSFYVDFFNDKDFSNIKNKVYKELPDLPGLDSKIKMIEIFDTKNFIDYIDSEVYLKFGSIENNKIRMELYINDEQIKLEYNGLLEIK